MTPSPSMQPSDRPAVEVLGVRFAALSRKEAAPAIARLAVERKRAYVVKPYSEFMPPAAGDAHIREVLNGADLCLADGIGILWAAHYLSLRGGKLRALIQLPVSLLAMVLNPSAVQSPLPEAMAGIDLTWAMLAELERATASVYLLGGTAEELAAARSRIKSRHPHLHIAGDYDGYFNRRGKENDRVIEAINKAAPNALLVAMGFPRQERWIADNIVRLDVGVAVAEGGSFSFISGATRRAPEWMRSAGLEWLYRLLRQPSRIRRQLALPVFVWLVVRERLTTRG
jgi:N-acetylglucosaminyldiphosphoundecaprenol N-acetyl-beta-D-mannosaminyltransferase